jgi:hypothetical protein
MATIHPLFRDTAFEPGVVQTMAEAFDKACSWLHDLGQPPLIKEIIARRIIEVAQTGERDPDELCRRALKAIGIPDR